MRDQSNSTMAQKIAQAAIAFEQRRTGNDVPKAVTVVLSEGILVITLHEALSPAGTVLAKNPAGAAQMQEFHPQLFTNSSDSLRQQIKRITGMEGREATAEIEPASDCRFEIQICTAICNPEESPVDLRPGHVLHE
jgi:uncharacterized protein YbcI